MILLSSFVSVLINNYNYGRYIGEAIESVLNQTYRNFELIIVDDGSTDNSREVIEKFKIKYEKLITVVYKKNGGQASAFNAGYQIAKGEIIAFLDSDDYWFPQKLEKIVAAHKEYEIVEHSSLCSGEYCRWTPTKDNAQKLLKVHGEVSEFSETSSLSFSKTLLEKIFPIPEEQLKICSESFVLLGAVYHSNKIKTLRKCLSFYRIHGDNNYINNPNADKQHRAKFVALYNSTLKSEQLPPIIFGENKIASNLEVMSFSKEYKYAIYGLGKASSIITTFLSEKNCFLSFYIDSNIEKRNPVNNIYHYNDLVALEDKYDYIIIASSYVREIKRNLMRLSIPDEKVITIY